MMISISFSSQTSSDYGHLRHSHATFFQSNICYIVPKLIIEAPIQPLLLTSKSLTFLQRRDIPLSSNSWPLVVVDGIQILALKPYLFWNEPSGKQSAGVELFQWGLWCLGQV